jgi:hypothetical protein
MRSLAHLDGRGTAGTRIIRLVKTRIPHRLGLVPVRDIQVLCPMNGGGVGARSLNIELQVALSPAGERKIENDYDEGGRAPCQSGLDLDHPRRGSTWPLPRMPGRLLSPHDPQPDPAREVDCRSANAFRTASAERWRKCLPHCRADGELHGLAACSEGLFPSLCEVFPHNGLGSDSSFRLNVPTRYSDLA